MKEMLRSLLDMYMQIHQSACHRTFTYFICNCPTYISIHIITLFSCLMAVSSFIIDHCSLVKTDHSTMLKSSLSTAGQSL